MGHALSGRSRIRETKPARIAFDNGEFTFVRVHPAASGEQPSLAPGMTQGAIRLLDLD